jgi:hypothetical protein
MLSNMVTSIITREEKFRALNEGQVDLDSLYDERLKRSNLAARKVKIDYKLSDNFCEWVIADEGKGFDWESFLSQLNSDPLGMECKGLFVSKYHLGNLEFMGKGNLVRARKLRSLK